MTKYVIGVDESGCGALAGPLVVAAAAFPADMSRIGTTWKGIRGEKQIVVGDSKGIKDQGQRAVLAQLVKESAVVWTIIQRTAAEIDARLFGTVFPEAVQLAAARTIENLFVLFPSLVPDDVMVLVDGDIQKPKLPCPTHCIPDGDVTDWRIGAASLVARARYDESIDELAQNYPTWGFETHRGYGTKKHRELLAKRGPTPEHRKSFKPVMASMPRTKGIEE